jgi:hypothetical protein
LAAAPVRVVFTESVPSAGPSSYVPGWIDMGRDYY